MKKTYIIPSVNIVRTETENLLTESISVDPNKQGGNALVQENDWDIWGEEE
ncbi:MAG: hypothetical protein J6W75_02790 [Bacteroidaceae bacterium]|nr:hypothetical protein [Bacteroidaceae bacterium]